MDRKSAPYIGAAVIASGLIVLAYLVAPHSCEGGLELYTWCGGAALLLLLGLPFAARMGRSILIRLALSVGFLVFGAGVWLAGLLVANVRFICGLGYL